MDRFIDLFTVKNEMCKVTWRPNWDLYHLLLARSGDGGEVTEMERLHAAPTGVGMEKVSSIGLHLGQWSHSTILGA